MDSKKSAHSKGITALTVYDSLVLTGASDSLVKVWQISSNGDGGLFYRYFSRDGIEVADALYHLSRFNRTPVNTIQESVPIDISSLAAA